MKKYLSESTPSQGDFLEAIEFLKSSVEEVAEYVMHQRHLTQQVNALTNSMESGQKEKARLIQRNAELAATVESLKAINRALMVNLENTRAQCANYLNQLQSTNINELVARIAKLKHAQETGKPKQKIHF